MAESKGKRMTFEEYLQRYFPAQVERERIQKILDTPGEYGKDMARVAFENWRRRRSR